VGKPATELPERVRKGKGMLRSYVTRRLLEIIPVLMLLTVLLFTLIELAPGDPLLLMFGNNPNATPEEMATLSKYYGLDQPVPVRYVKWLSKVLRGDFGSSRAYHMPVMSIVKQKIPQTVLLTTLALILSILVALPIGVYSALKPYSIGDYVQTFLVYLGRSMPGFWFGLMTIIIFAVKLRWLPAGGMTGMEDVRGWGAFVDGLKHLTLPLAVLTFLQVTGWVRYIRSSMLDTINADYVRTARAKGLKERTVIYKHALRNALIPVITLVALDMPGLLGGTVIVETVFSWPGMGRLLYDAIMNKDVNLAMACLLLLGLLTVSGSLLADIAYAVVDPRVRYGQGK